MNVVNYKDSHTFPGGLHLNYYSELESRYINDRDSVASQKDLDYLLSKWKYLFPEFSTTAVDFDTLQWFRSTDEIQKSFVGDEWANKYFDIICPITLFLWVLKAQRYGVTTGVVVLQLWNSGNFEEMSNGTWRLK